MSRLPELLFGMLAANLPPEEREAVCGDLNEMQRGVWAGLRELIGLLLRREVKAWSSWRVCLGVAAIATIFLIPASRLSQLAILAPMRFVGVYLKYEVLYHSGLSIEREAIQWLCQITALVLFAWSAGMAFGRLFRSAALLRLLALSILWICISVMILHRRGAPWWGLVVVLLIYFAPLLVPAVFGASIRRRLSPRRSIVLLAATVIAVALLTWTSGWWQASITEMNGGYKPELIPWYTRSWPWLLAAWPAVYISLNDLRKERRTV